MTLHTYISSLHTIWKPMTNQRNYIRFIKPDNIIRQLKFRKLRNKGRWLMLEVRCLPD